MELERRSQWLRGVLDLCVLGLLAQRESYGYELIQSLSAAGLGTIQGGTLYPVLLRLQRSGQVAAYWREGAAGPARKYYRITPEGGQTLRRAAADWQSFAGGVDVILREVAAR
ncbi:PadR family transcriptional regulator [Catellatospora sp. NPDC049609]|uniref:PadR family transcriptional regulator n=1 Tax=Catellatospora sp. NPDC049609 TaxID=3155505 RepID=UPI003435A053